MRMILDIFNRHRAMTGDVQAAAVLTLAEVLDREHEAPLTVTDAAKRLKMSPDTVYGLCESGKLPHSRIGNGRGRIRITQDDLAAFQKPTVKLRDLLS